MTNAEYLAQSKTRLTSYLLAEAAINKGAQSYSIGNRTLTRADLKIIADKIEELSKLCLSLSRGSNIRTQRVVVRDL